MSQSPERPSGEPDNAGSKGFEGGMLELLPSLRRYARSLTRSDADGEDLLQDSLERALSRRGQWRGLNMKSWLFTIMTNIYRSHATTARRRPVAPIEEAENLAAPVAAGDPLEQRRLAAAIDSLPAEQRAVLMLVVLEDCSYRQVADILDIPIGTVMSRLARARATLGGILSADNVIPLRRSE